MLPLQCINRHLQRIPLSDRLLVHTVVNKTDRVRWTYMNRLLSNSCCNFLLLYLSAVCTYTPPFVLHSNPWASADRECIPRFLQQLSSVPPGANAVSNAITSRAITALSSMYASCLPIQPQYPSAKGMNAGLFLINSGFLHQHFGMNSSG